MRIQVVRLFNVYGPRTQIDDGRAVSNFITQALRKQPITIYGSGKQSRSWGYIDDIVDALERLFWLDNVTYQGPVNVGNDREVSVLEVAQYIQSLVPDSSIEFGEPVPQDPTNRRPDLTLLRSLISGWSCKVPYEDGIRRTMDWFREKMLSELSPAEG